jgi:hypothetical protein
MRFSWWWKIKAGRYFKNVDGVPNYVVFTYKKTEIFLGTFFFL